MSRKIKSPERTARCPRSTHRSRGSQEKKGVASVEFAVVLTFLLIPVIFGSIEFLRIQMIRNQAHVASYEAARYCMVPGSTKAEAAERGAQFMTFLGPLEPTVVCDAFDSDGNSQNEINDFTSRVQVTVQVPVEESFFLSMFFGGKTLSAETNLTFESYSGFYDGSSY